MLVSFDPIGVGMLGAASVALTLRTIGDSAPKLWSEAVASTEDTELESRSVDANVKESEKVSSTGLCECI